MMKNNSCIGFKGYITDCKTGKKTLIPAKEDVARLNELTARVKNANEFDVVDIKSSKKKTELTIKSKVAHGDKFDVTVGKYNIKVFENIDTPQIWEAKLYSVYTPSLDKALKAAKGEFLKAVDALQGALKK